MIQREILVAIMRESHLIDESEGGGEATVIEKSPVTGESKGVAAIRENAVIDESEGQGKAAVMGENPVIEKEEAAIIEENSGIGKSDEEAAIMEEDSVIG